MPLTQISMPPSSTGRVSWATTGGMVRSERARQGLRPSLVRLGHLIGDDGAAPADGTIGAGRRVAEGLALQLRVDLRADADREGRDVEPQEEHHDSAERPEGLVVAGEGRDVEGEQQRAQ